MNPQNYSVFEDLYELSQAADNLIQKTLSVSHFDGSFFEDTKKEICRILTNKSPLKKKKSERKSFFFRPKRDSWFEPFLDTRAHVHKKQCLESLKESTTPVNVNKEYIACNNTEVSDISLFDKYKVKIQNNKGISTDDSCDEFPHQLQLDNERNSETFEKYSTPYDSNVCKNTYNKMPENVDSGNFHEISPISNEFLISPVQNEETIIISSDCDSSSSQKVTFENTDNQSTVEIISPSRVINEIKDTFVRCEEDTEISDLKKSYILSSDKNNIHSNFLNSLSELCCECASLSFSDKKQYKNKESKSFLQDYGVFSKNHSPVISSGYVSGNPSEEKSSEKPPVNLRTKQNEELIVNDIEIDKKTFLIQYQNENTSSENGKLSILASKEPLPCSKKAINIPSEKICLTTNRKNVTTFENHSYLGEKNSTISSQSLGSLSTDSEKSRIQENKSIVIENVPIQHYKGKYKRKSMANKNHSAHFRTFPAPVNRKVTTRNPRPQTPVDFMNSKHQSLKVKAEEKRKQREIRVQRTRERRERLEQEREERMRDREQKLKKKLQQHEEIPKQKTQKFKIKSRIRERRYNKRSGASTSSKDSKEDRTKDNDDFCRNSVNSGQKLYKESNGNLDVTPRENDLVSLDGDVGPNPKVSPKDKLILKNCEQTPVGFSVYNNSTKTVNTVSSKKSKKLQFQKNSNSKQVTVCNRPTSLKHNKENVLNKSEENESPKMVEVEENFEHEGDDKCKTQIIKKSKNIDKASKKLLKSYNSKNNQNIYLLRSCVTTDFSLKKGDNSKIENSRDGQVKAKRHKNSEKSPVKEKIRTHLCFNINKNKPKKVIKVSRKEIYESNACKYFTKPTKFKTYRLYDSSKESERVFKAPGKTQIISSIKSPDKTKKISSIKSPDKTKKIIPYEIPEEVDDSSGDTTDDSAKVPVWATGVYLKQALIQQLYFPPNVEDIFGVLHTESVNLAVLFGEDKPSYHQRTSSGNWSLNETPK